MSGVQLRRAGSALAGAAVAVAALGWATPASADAIQSGQWYLSKLGVRQAWTITKGAGVKIGIIDTGVDGTATDLIGAVGAGKDFSGKGSSNGQKPVNDDNHGTNVASLAAGRGHGPGHASGVLGTAPAATVISASFEVGASTDASPLAIRWAVDNGARVISLSYYSDFSTQQDAIRYAESKDVVVVAATGDTAQAGQRNRVGPPASFPGVLAVTGVDENLQSDPGAVIGTGTALAAPFSTTPSDPDSGKATTALPVANPRGYAAGPYSERVGTSFSAPIVAGIVALVRQKFPKLDAANVINRLLKTATPEGGSVPNTTYGYGVVNAYKALTANVAPVTANPLGSLVDSTGPTSGSPATGPNSSSPAGSSSSRPGSSDPGSSAPAQSSGSGSSGLGTGAWVAIAAVVVVAVALIGWLLSRNRRPPPGAPPPGYPPPGYPPR